MRLKTNAPALIHYSHDKGAGVCANTQKDETALVAFKWVAYEGLI